MNRFAMRNTALLLLLAAFLLHFGCANSARSGSTSPYQPMDSSLRSPLEAERLTLKAAELIGENDAKAEQLLREALTADLYHGPAHNNLGVVYLNQDKLYEAASEFEWARKLMPGHPDPRMNLALTLERAGRTNEALATYETALEVYPGHVPTMQALARLQLQTRRTDERTAEYLGEIALRGQTESWRNWAKRQLALRGSVTSSPAGP